MVLIDTDVFVDFFRNHSAAHNFFASLQTFEFSAVTEAELLVGKVNDVGEIRAALLAFLAHGQKVVVDNPISQLAGDIRRKHGLTLPDAIIAATAIIKHEELYSRNLADFNKVPGLQVKAPY